MSANSQKKKFVMPAEETVWDALCATIVSNRGNHLGNPR